MNFTRGDIVDVPDPLAGDIWNNSFVGEVRKVKDGVATVVDQEDNAFDVECDRLELVEVCEE